VYSCTGVLLYTARAIGNCVYSCNGVLLYTAQVIVCTAVLFYCYIEHREICLQLYRCTVICSTGICCVQLYCFTLICSTGNCLTSCTVVMLYTALAIRNCVYSCTGVPLFTAQGILCTAVLVYCYIQQWELCVHPYCCTFIYSRAYFVYSCTLVLLYTAQ